MSTEIQELTPDQLAAIPDYRKKWSAIGLNCEPANRERALVHFKEAYASIKAAPPRYTVWAQSPLMGCFMCGLFADPEKGAYKWLDGKSEMEIVTIAKDNNIDTHQFFDRLESGEVRADLPLTVETAWFSLWHQLHWAVQRKPDSEVVRFKKQENRDLTYSIEILRSILCLHGQFERHGPMLYPAIMRIGKVMFDEYIANRLQEVEAAGRQKAWDACYGSHDASWLGFYEFFRDVVKYEKCNELNGLIGAAKCAGWFWPFESLCIASERHDAIHLDENERLSNTKGPAVHYRDGFAISAVSGVAIPDWIIKDPSALTAQHILNERNQEVRRIMLGHFYPREKFLKDIGATMIAEDECGKLWRGTSGDLTVSAVEVVNGTVEKDGSRKTYFLGALNTHRTPKAAVAWSYNLEESTYKEAIRT